MVLVEEYLATCANCGLQSAIPSVIDGKTTENALVFFFCDENCDLTYRLANNLPDW